MEIAIIIVVCLFLSASLITWLTRRRARNLREVGEKAASASAGRTLGSEAVDSYRSSQPITQSGPIKADESNAKPLPAGPASPLGEGEYNHMFGQGKSLPEGTRRSGADPLRSTGKEAIATPDIALGIGATPSCPTTAALRAANFTITAPRVLSRGHIEEIRFWIHTPRQREAVVTFAEQAHGQPLSQLVLKSDGPYPIEPGSMITVRISVRGLKCIEAHKTVLWTRDIASVGFLLDIRSDVAQGGHVGSASIQLGGLQIAKMSFSLTVGDSSSPAGFIPSITTCHRKGFASYASEDRAEVVARVQGMEAAYKGLRVFLDVVTLRSGEAWELELNQHIRDADIFYLFWCRHSRASEWVAKEWRFALETKGLEFIDPVPLEEPIHAAPPPELSGKHFNDPLLTFAMAAGGVSSLHRPPS